MKKILYTLLVIILIVTGCKKEDDADTTVKPNDSSIYFFAYDAAWEEFRSKDPYGEFIIREDGKGELIIRSRAKTDDAKTITIALYQFKSFDDIKPGEYEICPHYGQKTVEKGLLVNSEIDQFGRPKNFTGYECINNVKVVFSEVENLKGQKIIRGSIADFNVACSGDFFVKNLEFTVPVDDLGSIEKPKENDGEVYFYINGVKHHYYVKTTYSYHAQSTSFYSIQKYNKASVSDKEASVNIDFGEYYQFQMKVGDTLVENTSLSYLDGCRVKVAESKQISSKLYYVLTETESDGELDSIMKGTIKGEIPSIDKSEIYTVDSGYFNLRFK